MWRAYWKGCGMMRSWPSLRHYPGICAGIFRKITKQSWSGIACVLAEIRTSSPFWIQVRSIATYAYLLGKNESHARCKTGYHITCEAWWELTGVDVANSVERGITGGLFLRRSSPRRSRSSRLSRSRAACCSFSSDMADRSSSFCVSSDERDNISC